MIEIEKSLKHVMKTALKAAMPEDKFKFVLEKPPGKLIVLGAGKAAASMASEFEKSYDFPIEVIEASHPVPDQAGLDATRKLFNLAKSTTDKDHVIFLISGGASSLLTLPLDGITFKEKQRISSELLMSGAPIDEMNIVRRSLSQIKGGRLAEVIYPAKITTYMISDIPGDDPSYIGSGPTIQATGKNEDSIAILRKYRINISPKIEEIILRHTLPKLIDAPMHMISTPMMALKSAARTAEIEGYIPIILSDSLEGEASTEGKKMAELALDIQKNKKYNNIYLNKPILLLSGGETTVTVKGNGRGGRNSEFMLSMAITLKGNKNIDALAIDTDGIDGVEDNAGAYISSNTLNKAKSNNLNPLDYLMNNDAYSFFEAIGDLIITSPTLTNVNDFRAVLIRP